MLKIILYTFLLTNTVNISAQLINFQLPEILNNLTVSDISNILRQIPLPNPLMFDGLPISHNDIIYYLYTKKNPNVPVILKRSSTKYSSFDPRFEVKFLIHGWMESANRTYYRGIIDAYLQRGEYNIIAVDWFRASLNEYSIAARNTKSAGRELGNFILRLNKATGVPLNQIHLLGHSLGAHMAGFAGKEVIKRTGQKIGRISGLDAAGPLFEMPIPVDKNNRLDKNDADFVDCIHTDGGIFGMTTSIGHADFYPNGGVPRQPGCSLINTRELSSRVILEDMFCSHTRSHELFTESINSNKLQATECESYQKFKAGLCAGNRVVQMGEDANSTIRGNFYLDTNAYRPFQTL